MKSIVVLLVCIQVLLFNASIHDKWEDEGTFPKSIPHYPVRIDKHTNKEVERGRFELLKRDPSGMFDDASRKVNLTEFKRVLQCAPKEPSINGNRGIIDMLKMIPPTSAIIDTVAVYADTGCEWRECQTTKLREYKKDGVVTGKCKEARKEKNLLRVINGKLYFLIIGLTFLLFCLNISRHLINP
jgi:hypothetical protein